MSTMTRMAREILDVSWQAAARRAARVYVAGPELADAMRTCGTLSRAGLGTIVCRWNDRTESPRRVADTYLAASEAIARGRLDCHLAIKVPALDLSPDLVSEVVLRAGIAGVSVRFDAQAHRFAEATLTLAEELSGRVPWLGVVLPGRWRRSLDDADRMAEVGLPVRVVKGQYPDPAHPEPDLRAGFLAVVRRLAGKARHVAVATHDGPLAREALRVLRQAGTPCALELLLGLPFEEALGEAMEARVPVRVYVPYGVPSVPYHYTTVRNDPRVVSWLIQDLLFKEAFRLPRATPEA